MCSIWLCAFDRIQPEHPLFLPSYPGFACFRFVILQYHCRKLIPKYAAGIQADQAGFRKLAWFVIRNLLSRISNGKTVAIYSIF